MFKITTSPFLPSFRDAMPSIPNSSRVRWWLVAERRVLQRCRRSRSGPVCGIALWSCKCTKKVKFTRVLIYITLIAIIELFSLRIMDSSPETAAASTPLRMRPVWRTRATTYSPELETVCSIMLMDYKIEEQRRQCVRLLILNWLSSRMNKNGTRWVRTKSRPSPHFIELISVLQVGHNFPK